MRLPSPLHPATLLRRVNRFVAEVEASDGVHLAHVPNSGRLAELLFPGNRVYVSRAGAPLRVTGRAVSLAEPVPIALAAETGTARPS